MKKNVGTVDMIVRIVLGVIILLVGWYFNTWWGLIGIVPIVTALIGWCPGYLLFKWSTYKGGSEESKPEV
jgi:hypothetical protein